MDPNESAQVSPEMKRLEELEKALPGFNPATGTQNKGQPSAKPAGDRAPAADDPGSKPPISKQADTLSDAEKAEQTEIDTAKAEADKAGQELKIENGKLARGTDGKFIRQPKTVKDEAKQDDKGPGSKYAKDKARRDDSWKALNAEKESFAAEKAKFQQELDAQKQQFQAQQSEFQRQQQETNAANTPESYDQLAVAEAAKVAKLLAAAKVAEDSGDFDNAEQLREAAATSKGFQKLAIAKAEQLRKNPPPNDKQREEDHKKSVTEWMVKGAQDFPEFAKKDSPVQNAAKEFLNEVQQHFPALTRIPQMVYFAARYATAKTAADRVPALEKELGELRTKVTDLEALTNPTSSGGATALSGDEKPFEQMSQPEQLAWLRRQAASGAGGY